MGVEAFLYQAVVGGLVFAVGMGFAWRQGYAAARPGWMVGMVAGLVAIAALQAGLQFAPMAEAPPVPWGGNERPGGVLGTPLDYAVIVAYFGAILAVGTLFAGGQKTTSEFFFGGQRFSWWLIAMSLVATTIGSYSFVKYSTIAWEFGLASTQTYLNDWFWLPLLIFGWLPILYFGRLTSIPEYFEHRFDKVNRRVVTALLLLYLVGYVGINLFTMGKALNVLVGWPVFGAAAVTAAVTAVYVTAGGQTSVIMTDLLQGVLLLATGALLLVLGAVALGGPGELWVHMPRGHRMAFPAFSEDPSYPAVGIFWQDGIANTAMFYFLNQGILMRFMAARSVEEGRKAAVATFAVLMPIAAVVVASGGWVGRALAHAGLLPSDLDGDEVFFIAAEMLAVPGVFGLIMAALTAALMSTVDSLITAVAAIVVNDVVRPMRPEATDAELLRAARWTSVAVTLIGVALVPVFASFSSVYAAHGTFTAAVTPPMVVALLLGVFWKRYTAPAALATMVGGTLAVFASLIWPELVTPFAHGVPMTPPGVGLLGGAKSHTFMRACYGIVVSGGIGVAVTLVTRPRPEAAIRGWVWGTVPHAVLRYTGRPLDQVEVDAPSAERVSDVVVAMPRLGEAGAPGPRGQVQVSAAVAHRVGAEVGDILYVSDTRWWLGGLRSGHAVVAEIGGEGVALSPELFARVVGRREGICVSVQRLY